MDIINFLFPKICIGCKKSGEYLCIDCLNKQKYTKQNCIVCERSSIDGMTHSICKSKFMLDGCYSIWNYEGMIRKGLLCLKYKFADSLAGKISKYTSILLKENNFFPNNSVLIPVPLHISRKNWRGFNQAEILGKPLSFYMQWNYIPDLVLRKKKSKPQTDLKQKQRKKNLRGVFSLNPKYSLTIKSKTFIVFDDVRTTGTTLKEVGKTLKKAGYKKVWGLTIAK